MLHWSNRVSGLVWRMAMVVAAGAAMLVAGCETEGAGPDVEESRFPTEEGAGEPGYRVQSASLTEVKSCLAALGHAGHITGVSQLGAASQMATSTALPCLLGNAQCTFGLLDCYLVVSSGNASSWSTSPSVSAGGGCEPDPVFGTLCDKGGAVVSVAVPAGKTRIELDYRFFEWDYDPFEDPFSITLLDPAGKAVASTGSYLGCELAGKTGTSLAIGHVRTVELDVSAYQGQTVGLELRASDRFDASLDAGAVINNLRVLSGATSCGGAVCGGCAGAASCAAIDEDGDGVSACTDCDDGDATVFPGAAEVCDGADNDCDGSVDVSGGASVCAPPDADGDGADASVDCDDGDATVFPGAPEICDFQDNDCDGVVDEDTCAVVCTTIANGVNGGATADAALLGDYPTSPDFGATSGYTGVSSGGNENFTLFRFDLAPIEAQAGGQTVNVTSATFQVSVTWNEQNNQVDLHGCNVPWDEATVTLASYPTTSCDESPAASFAAGGSGYHAVDVTALAGAWLSGARPNHGFVLREPTVHSHGYWLKGSSVSLQPKLDVCYFLSAAPPAD